MPPGGAGYYYFHTNLLVDDAETNLFDIVVNSQQTCTAHGDSSSGAEFGIATCSISVYVQEGMC